MWTSAKKLQATDPRLRREFCSIVNAILRMDLKEPVQHVVPFARAVNQLCIIRGVRDAGTLRFPPGGVLWRGSSLPNQHKAFFEVGAKYRVPGFLASSLKQEVTYRFIYEAYDQGLPAVSWRIELDPRGEADMRFRCKHVNYVSNSHFGDDEAEFLFAPYSVFEVIGTEWSIKPDDDNPHKITLRLSWNMLSSL